MLASVPDRLPFDKLRSDVLDAIDLGGSAETDPESSWIRPNGAC